jgi:DNA-binding XRE family transcriptional regulator
MERLRNTNGSGKYQSSLELAFRIAALFGKRIEEIFVFVDEPKT